MAERCLSRIWLLRVSLLLLSLALLAPVARAKDATPLAADPALEARVMAISEELRCLVCQNETLAASQADLAVDLRKQIALKLQAGQSNQDVIDFMVARYGDFVLYRPPLGGRTMLLWFGPFVLLLVALVALVWTIRRRRAALPAQVALSDDDTARARALLGDAARGSQS